MHSFTPVQTRCRMNQVSYEPLVPCCCVHWDKLTKRTDSLDTHFITHVFLQQLTNATCKACARCNKRLHLLCRHFTYFLPLLPLSALATRRHLLLQCLRSTACGISRFVIKPEPAPPPVSPPHRPPTHSLFSRLITGTFPTHCSSTRRCHQTILLCPDSNYNDRMLAAVPTVTARVQRHPLTIFVPSINFGFPLSNNHRTTHLLTRVSWCKLFMI